MCPTLAIIIVIALLDITSMVPIAIIPLAAMLAGRRAYAESLS